MTQCRLCVKTITSRQTEFVAGAERDESLSYGRMKLILRGKNHAIAGSFSLAFVAQPTTCHARGPETGARLDSLNCVHLFLLSDKQCELHTISKLTPSASFLVTKPLRPNISMRELPLTLTPKGDWPELKSSTRVIESADRKFFGKLYWKGLVLQLPPQLNKSATPIVKNA